MHQKTENLTENQTTPMVSEIYTKESINDENQVSSWIAFVARQKKAEKPQVEKSQDYS